MNKIDQHFSAADNGEINTLFSLYHYGEKIADFRLGAKKEWFPVDERYDDIFPIADGERIPTFLRNLKPEGWLKENLNWAPEHTNGKLQVGYISQGMRFLSNFIIKRADEPEPKAKNDTILDDLASYIDEKGKFIGRYKGPNGRAGDKNFESRLSQMWGNRNTARYSGAEIKTPHCLNPDGSLEVASDKPFNVLLKHAGQDENDSLGMNEFMGLSMAKAVGLETPSFCVIEQEFGLPPIFAIERYDISLHGASDPEERLITQDFCTLLGKNSSDKGMGTVLEVAKCLERMNNDVNPDDTKENLKALLVRSILSHVVNDADMHLKNLSALISYNSKDLKTKSIRFSPSYDITTDILCGREGHGQVLGIEGKKNGFKVKTFLAFAKRLNIFENNDGSFDSNAAEKFIVDIAEKAAEKAFYIYNNPPIENLSESIRYDMATIVSHVIDRAKALGANTPKWDSNAVWSDLKDNGLRARQNKVEFGTVKPRSSQKRSRRQIVNA